MPSFSSPVRMLSSSRVSEQLGTHADFGHCRTIDLECDVLLVARCAMTVSVTRSHRNTRPVDVESDKAETYKMLLDVDMVVFGF